MRNREPAYDLRPCTIAEFRHLFETHHGYGGCGNAAVYAFAVYEHGAPVAAYLWQPPPHGAAAAVCPEAPAGVLALSRMVAVPRSERALQHISRPLRRQMRALIDRTRWPVLVTYSDEGQGHTGHVYLCSGWEKTTRAEVDTCTVDGVRVSRYSNGKTTMKGDRGTTWIQRWEHWACPRGEAALWMAEAGWVREAIPGKVWRSGRQAHRWVRREPMREAA